MSNNAYKTITDRIIASLEEGCVPWAASWDEWAVADASATRSSFMPFNAKSRKPYRSINRLLLAMACQTYGYKCPAFLTFKQAIDMGGSVKKGEKGHEVIIFKPSYKDDPKSDKYLTAKEVKEREAKGLPIFECGIFANTFHVFNVEQCNNITVKDLPVVTLAGNDIGNDIQAVNLLSSAGADVMYGVSPHYRHGADKIGMPKLDDFAAVSGAKAHDHMFAVAAHELVHWTGAKHRLARCDENFVDGHKNAEYAFEELVAELGSSFLCAEFGIQSKLQHEAYIKGWLKELKNDPRFIFKAASYAEKAVSFIHEAINKNLKQLAA